MATSWLIGAPRLTPAARSKWTHSTLQVPSLTRGIGRQIGVSHVALIGLEPLRHSAREVAAHRAPGQRGEPASRHVEPAALGQGQGSRVGQSTPPVGGKGLGGAL